MTTARIKEILSWYRSDNNGVLTNLHKMLTTGTLAGTGKLVILPVDQGFEHGPIRTYGPNPPSYDPTYFFDLGIESGCNAYAAPFGQLTAVAHDYIGEIPLIVKVNNSDTLFSDKDPISAVTCSVKDALQLGASAIGFTIYPGSGERKQMYEEIREMGAEARSYGLPVIIWSYPRGSQISKDGETAIDVVSYAAQIACQLGAHIVKVKAPSAHLEQNEAKKVYESKKVDISTLAARTKHVVESCFGGRRIVIFSGGATKGDAEVLEEVRELHRGGAFGSIMGRNAFQRPKSDGLKLLKAVMEIFKAK